MGVVRHAVKLNRNQIKMMADELADMGAVLNAISCKMEDNKIKTINVTHYKSFNTGIGYCGNFCNAASAGWRDAALGI